jgi:methionyl-tRNA synthetase
MGKDNLVFHTLFWPAQLYGAFKEIHLPDYPIINHFLTLEERPFSKSRGIFLSAKYLGEKYGIDPVRFYLTLIMPETTDSSFSWSDFVQINNNVIIGTFGNFIYRTLKLSESKNKFSEKDLEKGVLKEIENLIKKCQNHLQNCQFKDYAKTIVEIADFGNKYLQKKNPWNFNKESKEFKETITTALFILLGLNLVCEPLIPSTNQKLSKMLGIKIKNWPKEKTIDHLKKYLAKIKIENPKPLFTKISSSVVEIERSKINI